MKKPFQTEANNYTLYGSLLGLFFPMIGLLLIFVAAQGPTPVSPTGYFLFWLTLIVPLLLGTFARLAGSRQDQLQQSVDQLQDKSIALRQAILVAEHANHAKSELLSNVNHELRTPLGGILGYTEMLQEEVFGVLSQEQQAALAEIMICTHRLTTLIDRLIDHAQSLQGHVELDIATFNSEQLIMPLQEILTSRAQAKGLNSHVETADSMPATITGDRQRLQQIISSLLLNAVQFTEKGGVQARFFAPDAGHWAVTITDTGPGIPREARTYIFEPFRLVDNSANRRHAAPGLGLAIVKQLTQLFGGEVTLKSELGKGSTFMVTFPRKWPPPPWQWDNDAQHLPAGQKVNNP